jgi:hypothetical protein
MRPSVFVGCAFDLAGWRCLLRLRLRGTHDPEACSLGVADRLRYISYIPITSPDLRPAGACLHLGLHVQRQA